MEATRNHIVLFYFESLERCTWNLYVERSAVFIMEPFFELRFSVFRQFRPYNFVFRQLKVTGKQLADSIFV